jgi:superfamily II DNA or RNA helicase
MFLQNPLPPFVLSILGQVAPSWEAALKKLDQILELPASLSTGNDAPVAARPRSRLIWRVTCITAPSHYGERIALDPVEQTPSMAKRGGWNKGRVIGWERIAREPDLAVIPADYDILRAANLNLHQYTPYAYQLGLVFEALIGHPHVMVDTTPVVVRRGQLGLSMDEQETVWKLTPVLDGRPLTSFVARAVYGSTHLVAFDAERQELIVARATSQLTSLCTSLEGKPAVIPPDAQPEFLKRLHALESRIPIGLPASLKGELVEANAQISLRIHPVTPTGATIDFRVTPAPAGLSFVPGEGPVEAIGKREDDRVRVERDLESETLHATRLGEELFLNRFAQTERCAWKIDHDDEVLDLLDTLRARPENDPLIVWPEDGEVRRMTMLGEVSASSLKVEIKDQHDWFGLSGMIELGGQQFPLATLLAALRDGRRYISLGKGQFASITQAFRDRLASVADMLHSNRGKLEFNATAAPVIADLLDDHLALKVSKKWKATLTRLNRAADLDPQVPVTLTAELRDYQVEGYKWLRRLAEWGVGGILADDMGLGKTVQALAVLLDRRDTGPALVVAPVSVGFNWQRETERFAPTLRPILYRETDRDEFLKTLGPGDMLITSYYLMQQHADELSTVKWGTLVLDEAQYIKNSQTKTAQVVRTLEADWRLALTGTPCENHLGDLWSVFRGVSPGLFGSWERFREVFADPIEKGKVGERKHALSRVLRPFVLRRTKSEVLKELPARTEVQLMAELSAAERKHYEDARLWAVTHLTGLEVEDGKDNRFQVLAALTKLRQLACHPRLVDKTWDKSSAKLDLFLETIDELRDGKHRALVFSQFTSHLALIREALDKRKVTYQYLDGQTTPKQRQERVDAFQRGEGEFFLISLKAGGTGLNLTGADYVIHLDPWWNPAVEDQATDRAHRIGQTRPVTVYRLVARDTIEEQILKLHGDKRNLVAGVLDGTDQAAKLSTHELIDLIKLGGRQT